MRRIEDGSVGVVHVSHGGFLGEGEVVVERWGVSGGLRRVGEGA